VNINGVLAAVENARFARFCSDCHAAVGVVLDGPLGNPPCSMMVLAPVSPMIS
jgi:hypothetical protein